MTDDEFLAAFESCTLEFPAAWNHRAHLRVAYVTLERWPLEEAIDRVRAGIRRFNAANKVPEGPDRGYHETLTQTWMRIVHGLRTTAGTEGGFDAFLVMHPYLLEKLLPRLFYSRARMMSPEAKVRYLEPDRTPFPGSAGANGACVG